jgi:hypothetical protein
MNPWVRRLLGKVIDAEVEQRMQLALTDRDGFYEQAGAARARERMDWDREEVLRQALEAWRTNPLARRLVMLTSQYVVGGGVRVSSRQPAAHAFLQAWWDHPLNQFGVRLYEWCEELVRSGELFLLLSSDAAGMSYVRAVPAANIREVLTSDNDVQQETAYLATAENGLDTLRWPAYRAQTDVIDENGAFRPAMLHYAINRPVGAVRGESDLAPVLKWLARYSAWLEDRARLNRFRQTFLFVVRSRFASESERQTRQAALNAAPPNPGAILVTDESEEWSVLRPELDSFEAREDGLALKKMIAAGAGVPLHFLAEPEGTNRTTAESAGGPTFRHLEQRQQFFTWMVSDLARAALARRAQVDARISAQAPVSVDTTDLNPRDNQSLASSAAVAVGAFSGLYEKGLIDSAELLRLAYRFAGEAVDVNDLLLRAGAAEARKGESRD